MPPQTVSPQTPSTATEFPIYDLYHQLLEGWNNQDAHAFAATFAEDGSCVGYDGSLMNDLAKIKCGILNLQPLTFTFRPKQKSAAL